MMHCLHCGHLFEAQRSTAKFCSAKCRVAYKRHALSVTPPVTLKNSARPITLTAWFDHRPGPVSLVRDYADLIEGLAAYDRDALIQEIIAYRAELDDTREARQRDAEELRTLRAQAKADPNALLKGYEIITITSDVGAPQESVMKIIAPKPQAGQRRPHV